MLSIQGRSVRLCDGITRREALRVGGLALTGLTWSDWLRARAAAGQTTNRKASAKACILIYNYGGPSHIDTWDLKPDAPREIRGQFRPIATRVPGLSITEHLPRLAALADRYAVVRSVGHGDNDHAIGAYLTLTSHSHPKHTILGIEPPASPQDMPSMGSVVSKLRPVRKPLFSYVTLGDLRHLGNHDSMGQNAGCLGKAYDPFTLPFARPIEGPLDMSGITSVLGAVDQPRLDHRHRLLDEMTRLAPALEKTASLRHLDESVRKAHELLASSASRDAFDLEREPPKVRDFYGSTPFSQNCLLARRLVEAGVPMITVYSWGNRDWDTHGDNFRHLKDTLLPGTDRAVSALLEDLRLRGLLDETLVVWMGDMGRTPRINPSAGRDHWSFCYSVVLAGGGIRGGQVLGSSDRSAAYPAMNPVGPADIAATIYRCLGIDPAAHVMDQQGRPISICPGKPIEALLG